MGWGEVDDKLALQLEIEDLQVLDDADHEAIRSVVLQEFPSLSAGRVDRALDAFCATVPVPCHREALVEFLRADLRDELGAGAVARDLRDVSRGARGPDPARNRGVGRAAGARAQSRPGRRR